MPTYDYKCNVCSHAFEQFQSIKDKPLRACPSCGKRALERLIGTGGAIIFKGGGFYQTDYRSASYKSAAEADKPKSQGDGGAVEKPSVAAPASEKSTSHAKEKPSKGPATPSKAAQGDAPKASGKHAAK